MRSIGVFSPSGPQTFASQTSAHNGFYAMNRALSRNLAPGARLPKVGVMQSSQRTQLRSVQPAAGILGRTDFGGAQTTVVNDALRRVRNAGACAPKKKGAIKTIVAPVAPVAPARPNSLLLTFNPTGAYNLTFTTVDTNSFISGFNGLELSGISRVSIVLPTATVYLPATVEGNGILVPFNFGENTAGFDVSFETVNLNSSTLQLTGGDIRISSSYNGPRFFFLQSQEPLQCPLLNIVVPIDALQSPTCTASLFFPPAVDGSGYIYLFLAPVELTSYPPFEEPLLGSLSC